MSPPRRNDAGAGKGAKVSAGRCPVCRRPRDEEYKPFCSKRCADIDLARWLDGRYAIPGKDDEDESAPPPGPQDDE